MDAGAAAVGLPAIADGSALLIAVLSIVAPPLGLVALLGLLVAPVREPPPRRSEIRWVANPQVKKLVLVVIDAMKPEMLDRAIASGRAPALARIAQEGVYVNDVVAAFRLDAGLRRHDHNRCRPRPAPDPEHELVPPRGGALRRVRVELLATRQFGVVRSLTDTVYRMNAEHLSNDTLTVFESLDDLGVRTAGTTYLIYRGRYEHDVAQESALARVVTSTLFRRTILGPRELFYADLYASRKTGCRSQLGLPGVRDQHTGCVGSYLVEHDLFDFMLYSLPDNDAWSHKNGPAAQVTSIAAADRQIERMFHAGGGPEKFLEDHAVVVTSDHSQALVEERIRLDLALEGFHVATPSGSRSVGAELALSPSQRSAMIYALDLDRRDEPDARALLAVGDLEGVDLAMWLDGRNGGSRGRDPRPRRRASCGSRPAAS